jgi:hypothetical protein
MELMSWNFVAIDDVVKIQLFKDKVEEDWREVRKKGSINIGQE